MELGDREQPLWRQGFSMKIAAVSVLSHVQFFAIPWTVARQTPLVNGISQARILEWVAISFSGYRPNPVIRPTAVMDLSCGTQDL